MKSDPKASLCGFFNIHKPAGITSHDVVAKCRRLLGIKQIGHAGTLDPAATGVMVLAVGKATRLLRFLNDDKAYRAEILLGLTTDSDDLEGQELTSCSAEQVCRKVSEQAVRQTLQTFVGEIEQFPPVFSAIHVSGKRLYELARNADDLEELAALKAAVPLRKVSVHKLEDIEIDLPIVRVTIDCSKGTYIRSIARDLGEKLGVGGTLKSLQRTRSGLFALKEAKTLEELAELKDSGNLEKALTAVSQALPQEKLVLNREQVGKLCLGQKIKLDDARPLASTETFTLVQLREDEQDNARLKDILIASIDSQGVLSPEVVFGNVST